MVVPPLPVEITKYIIKQSLPPLRFDTFKERYELLRTFSLVDSTWRVLAQRELARHLVVGMSATNDFATLLVDFPNLGRQAVTLRATANAFGEEHIAAVVEQAHNRSQLQHLTLSHVNFTGSLSPLDQEGLRSCTLHYPDFAFSQRAPTMQHLRALYLVDPYFNSGKGDWLFLLNPTTFPSLRHVQLLRTSDSYEFSSDNGPDDAGGILPALLTLAPQLVDLSICETPTASLANSFKVQHWPLYTSLQYLTLNTCQGAEETTWLQKLKHLPPKLEVLTIIALKTSKLSALYGEIEVALRSWDKQRLNLRIRMLDPLMNQSQRSRVDGAPAVAEARRSLLRAAAEREVEVDTSWSGASFKVWETFFDD